MIPQKTENYEMHRRGEACYLTFPQLDRYQELRHLFTTRCGGFSEGPCATWNLGFGLGNDPDTPENRARNIGVLAECMGIRPEDLVFTWQTHTTNIRNVTEEDRGCGATRERTYQDVDGLVTDRRGVALVTLHADCNPIYFYDSRRHVIGLAHSGWRGTLDGIGSRMVDKMRFNYGCNPGDLICGIGPSLCRDCFEVDADVAGLFAERYGDFPEFSRYDGGRNKYYIDLWELIRRQLTSAGVRRENVACMGLCTKENTDVFFSHRGQGGKRGLMAACMMLTPPEQEEV